ncbi:MAG: hypothetical protein ACWA5U_08280 [bacterium]
MQTITSKTSLAYVLSTALSLTAFTLSSLPTTAAAKSCTNVVITGGTGRSPSLKNAKRNARIKWRQKVRIMFGNPYTVWSIANNKKYSCKKKYGVYRCKASAIPCRP